MILIRDFSTYFVGASFDSMSPLMKIARLCVAALTSSCALLIFSFASSSSSTLTLFLFSLDDMVAVEADVSTAGILKRKKEEIGGER
jgi:purine-cytosine permease-like protein